MIKEWSEITYWEEVAFVKGYRLHRLLEGHATPDYHCQNIICVAVALDESA
jgi:hypothetical protein